MKIRFGCCLLPCPRKRRARADGGVSAVVSGAGRAGKAQTHGFLSVFNSSQKHLGHMASRPGGHGTSVVSDSKTDSVCCYGPAVCMYCSYLTGLQPCKCYFHYYRLINSAAKKLRFRWTRWCNSKDLLFLFCFLYLLQLIFMSCKVVTFTPMMPRSMTHWPKNKAHSVQPLIEWITFKLGSLYTFRVSIRTRLKSWCSDQVVAPPSPLRLSWPWLSGTIS